MRTFLGGMYMCSGGVTTEEMSGKTEDAFLSAIKLHVTGNLALIRAAEEELIKNKVHAHICCIRPPSFIQTHRE